MIQWSVVQYVTNSCGSRMLRKGREWGGVLQSPADLVDRAQVSVPLTSSATSPGKLEKLESSASCSP